MLDQTHFEDDSRCELLFEARSRLSLVSLALGWQLRKENYPPTPR